MQIENFGDFTVANFDTSSEYLAAGNMDADISLIKSDQFDPIIKNDLWGTKYISWQKPVIGDFYESIPEQYRKRIRKDISRALRAGYTVTHFQTIPNEIFLIWLKELYIPMLDSKGRAHENMGEQWLETNSGKKHQAIAVFDAAHKLVGASLFFQKNNGDISFSFKAVDHTQKFDVNCLIEQKAFEIATALGSKLIRKGIDFNLYGGNLSLGLKKYKQKYGFTPVSYVTKKTDISYYRHLVINNPAKFDPESITYSANAMDLTAPLVESKVLHN